MNTNQDLPFIDQIALLVNKGDRTESQLQAFIEGRNPFGANNPLSVDDAIAILGEKRVITSTQACDVFDCLSPAPNTHIQYTEGTIRECAVLNKYTFRDFNWRLVYALPLSLREQFEIIGTIEGNQPGFCKKDDWWLAESEDYWAKSCPKAGYYLINFTGSFNRTNWKDQNTKIAELGDHYDRADERVLLQAAISNRRIHGEFLFENASYSGRMETSNGSKVWIGDFNYQGMRIGQANLSECGPCGYTCVMRKFDW